MLQTNSTPDPALQLRRAAAEGDTDKVRNLVDKEFKFINHKSSNGNTALHWSIKNKHYAVTKLLLTVSGIDVDASNKLGYTPLHLSAKQGDKKTVNRLLKLGAGHKNCIANDGFSPLDIAFREGYSFIVSKLKQKIPTMTIFEVEKAAGEALAKFIANKPMIVKDKIFDINYLFNEELIPFFLPSNLSTLADIQTAVTAGKLDPHKLFSSGNLLQSASVSHVDTLEKFRWLLLEQGVDPNLQAIQELNPSSYKNTALHTLIANESENNALELINLLKDNKKSFDFNLTDSEGKTCLCLAVKVGLSRVAMQLIALKDKVDIHIADEDGNTPLHYAFLLGHELIAIELMKDQSAKNAKNKNDQTPYELLNSTDIEDVKDCLEIIWINPDKKIKRSKKTYIQRCMENREKIKVDYVHMFSETEISIVQKRKSVCFLLAAATGDLKGLQDNCDSFTLNQTNARGNSALHLACQQGHEEIVKFLLQQPGIDLDKVNNNKISAADLVGKLNDLTLKTKNEGATTSKLNQAVDVNISTLRNY